MQDQAAKDKALQSMASMSSAQIVSASAIHNKALAQGLPMPNMGGSVRPSYPGGPSGSQVRHGIRGSKVKPLCSYTDVTVVM